MFSIFFIETQGINLISHKLKNTFPIKCYLKSESDYRRKKRKAWRSFRNANNIFLVSPKNFFTTLPRYVTKTKIGKKKFIFF